MARIHDTRESWLAALAAAMRSHFLDNGLTIPEKLRVTCGWPSSGALAKKGGSRTLGQCFYPECSKDQTTEVFVSPVVDDAKRVADILCHELVHAALPKAKHGRGFAKAALSLGLEGKPTATIGGAAFLAWARPLIEAEGEYPHASLDLTKMERKAQKGRQLKVRCPECGYTARTTKKWLETSGAPLCPCNREAMEPEVTDEEPEEVPEGEQEVPNAA